MDLSQYGPFAAIVAIIFAITALSNTLIEKALGSVNDWAALISVPLFILIAGPRAVSVVIISISFFTLTTNTRIFFGITALIFGIIVLILIVRFYGQREKYTCEIAIILPDGSQAYDGSGNPKVRRIIIGTEEAMLPRAREALDYARQQNPGLSLCDFLGGFGGSSTFSADAAWSRETLTQTTMSLLMKLTVIVLGTVLALYWAAAIVEVSARSG